jgi:HD-GYP domain-containing protein (c-di-GMP phosphodiesterase class II)
MYPRISVNLGNLLLSFSETLDLANAGLAMHQLRTAFIAWELAKQAKLSDTRQERLFVAALLHDIGALSVEEKYLLHEGHEMDATVHCRRGAALFRTNAWLAPSAALVLNHHCDFDTWRDVDNLEERFDAQILNLADYIERQLNRAVYILCQEDEIRRKVSEERGIHFAADAVDLFIDVSRREEFWLDLVSTRLYSLLLRNGPFRTIDIDIETITTFAELASRIVDFKSRFTSTHSCGVAQSALMLAQLSGLSTLEVKAMEVAGLLHDLGKLVVPNAILEKPASLTKEEFAVIRQHTYHTFSVLSSIQGLQQIAEWAAYHHERLDGKGYPFKLAADELSLGARIMMVADIFTALAEDRPYRKGMDVPRIKEILHSQAEQGALEPRIVELLLDNIGDVRTAVMARQEKARYEYEHTVEPSVGSTTPAAHIPRDLQI